MVFLDQLKFLTGELCVQNISFPCAACGVSAWRSQRELNYGPLPSTTIAAFRQLTLCSACLGGIYREILRGHSSFKY